MLRCIGVGESSNESVVHENIGVGKVTKETASIVESVGDCYGAMEEEFAGDKAICIETRLAYVCVYLLDMF